LNVLQAAGNGVEATLFSELCAGLFEPKRNALTGAFIPQGQHLAKITHSRPRTRLPSGNHLFDPLADVVWREVYAFGDYHKPKVAPLAYHIPRFGAPQVGIFEEKIGSEAGVKQCSRGDFILTVTLFALNG
jgi:hypothetical protein